MFASGRARDGRQVSWEPIGGNFGLQSATNEFNLETYNLLVPTGYNQRARVAVPTNLTRGQVTLERVRGFSKFYFFRDEIADANNPFFPPEWITAAGEGVATIWEALQLVPTVNGLLDTTLNDNPVLQIANAASQHSSRIVWQRTHHIIMGGNIGQTGTFGCEYVSSTGTAELDVKTRRRFDREEWSLLHTVEVADDDAPDRFLNIQVAFNMRAIFRTYDSL